MMRMSYPWLLLSILSLLAFSLLGHGHNAEINHQAFTLLNYEEMNKKIQSLMAYNGLFRVNDLFDLYPAATRSMCEKDTLCRSPIIEMTNFETNLETIMKLPTVLIVGGMHGDDVIGSNSILQFALMIARGRNESWTFQNLLTNVRVLMIPMVNASGYFHKVPEEVQNLGRSRRLDPQNDFNWDPKTNCFQSATAQLLNHVFKDNLIVGVLNLTSGSSAIYYPWGNKHRDSIPLSADNSAYTHISCLIRDAVGVNPKFDLPKLKFSTLEEVKGTIQGGFEDWAYAGSAENHFIQDRCQDWTSVYSTRFLETEDATNRALVMRVETNRSNSEINEEAMGNIEGALNKACGTAENGYISRNVLAIRAFIETMRPMMMINHFNFMNDVKTRKSYLIISVEVRGCRSVSSAKVSPSVFPEQELLTQPPVVKRNTQVNFMDFKIKILDMDSEQWMNPIDLEFEVICDEDMKVPKTGQKPFTHFYHAKRNPNFDLKYHRNRLGSIRLDKLVVTNFVLSKLIDVKIKYTSALKAELTYDKEYFIEFGGVPRFKINYNDESQEAVLSFVEIEDEMKDEGVEVNDEQQIFRANVSHSKIGVHDLDNSNVNHSNYVKFDNLVDQDNGVCSCNNISDNNEVSSRNNVSEMASNLSEMSPVRRDSSESDFDIDIDQDISNFGKAKEMSSHLLDPNSASNNPKKRKKRAPVVEEQNFEGIEQSYLTLRVFQIPVYYKIPSVNELVKKTDVGKYSQYHMQDFYDQKAFKGEAETMAFLKVGEPMKMTSDMFTRFIGKRVMVECSNAFFVKKDKGLFMGTVVSLSDGQGRYGAPVRPVNMNFSADEELKWKQGNKERSETPVYKEEQTTADAKNSSEMEMKDNSGFEINGRGGFCGSMYSSSKWIQAPKGLVYEDLEKPDTMFFFSVTSKSEEPETLEINLYLPPSAESKTFILKVPGKPLISLELSLNTDHAASDTIEYLNAFQNARSSESSGAENPSLDVVQNLVLYNGTVKKSKFRVLGLHILIVDPEDRNILSCSMIGSYELSNSLSSLDYMKDIRVARLSAKMFTENHMTFSAEMMVNEEPFDWRWWGICVLVLLGVGSLGWVLYLVVKKKIRAFDEGDFD